MAATVLKLSILIALPALSWYAAMPLTVVTDITAIYNTFAFWAYGLAVIFLGETPTRAKLASVVIAVFGVFVIAYGDLWIDFKAPENGGEEDRKAGMSRMIGNLLAFFGSVSYAWYEVSCGVLRDFRIQANLSSLQVWYKINGECKACLRPALPFSASPPFFLSSGVSHLRPLELLLYILELVADPRFFSHKSPCPSPRIWRETTTTMKRKQILFSPLLPPWIPPSPPTDLIRKLKLLPRPFLLRLIFALPPLLPPRSRIRPSQSSFFIQTFSLR